MEIIAGRDIAQYPHLLVVYPFITEASWSSISHIAIESLKGVFLKQPSRDVLCPGAQPSHQARVWTHLWHHFHHAIVLRTCGKVMPQARGVYATARGILVNVFSGWYLDLDSHRM